MANGSEFTSIVVTDEMVETAASMAGTSDLGGENLLKEVLTRAGLTTIRARGHRLTNEQLAAVREGRPTADQAREARMSCLSLFVKENNADPVNCCANLKHIDALAQYVLTGKKAGEA